MKNKIFNRLSSLVVIAAMLMGFTVSVSAGNDGLIGANIKDGQLLGYFGDGGDIKIPDTVTIIAGEAFLNNDNITSVTIPGSVQVIGYHAFDGCTELERVIFEDPTDGADLIIRLDAFANCPKLTECEIPAVASYVTANVFKGCSSMEKIKVHPQNPYYFTDDNGVMFGPRVNEGEPQYDDPNLTLTAYPSGREGLYSIPESVQGRTVDRIWSGAFKNAEKLTDIEIPENVKIIGGNAFEHSGLTDVTECNEGRFPFIKTKLINPLFIKKGISVGKFPATDACIACKRCEKVCPMLNIVMVGWKPVWGADCTSCLACYHVCPQKAVQYGKATKDKGQYFNPNVK